MTKPSVTREDMHQYVDSVGIIPHLLNLSPERHMQIHNALHALIDTAPDEGIDRERSYKNYTYGEFVDKPKVKPPADTPEPQGEVDEVVCANCGEVYHIVYKKCPDCGKNRPLRMRAILSTPSRPTVTREKIKKMSHWLTLNKYWQKTPDGYVMRVDLLLEDVCKEIGVEVEDE